MSPTSRYFTSQSLKLHYVDWGNAEKSPVVFVHGGRDHCRSWDWIAQALQAEKHVLALDLRGHGDSEWSSSGSYHLMDYVYDLIRFVQQIDESPVALVGHSLGGNIAIRFAGLYPELVSRLVAIEGLGPSPDEQKERLATPLSDRIRNWVLDQQRGEAKKPRRFENVDTAVQRMRHVNDHLSVEQASYLSQHGLRQNEDGMFSWKFDPAVRYQSPVDIAQAEFEQFWAAITCPVLLCYGADSWASNPERDGRAQGFGDARVIEYADAAHWLQHDQMQAFVDDLRKFL